MSSRLRHAAIVVGSALAGYRRGRVGRDPSGGVGVAYGVGRVAPALRTPALAASLALSVRRAGPGRRRRAGLDWVGGLVRATVAVAVIDEVAARLPWRGPRRRVVVVVNGDSGSPRLARRAVRALRREPVDVVDCRWVDGPGLEMAIRRALALLAGPGGVLVVAGGDGTVGLAAGLAADAGRPLGILPTGTGNDVARALRIPLAPEAAAAVVARGVVSGLDLGVVGSRRFAHAAAVGMTAGFAAGVQHVRGWRRPIVYPIRAWQAWRQHRRLTVTVGVDGRMMTVHDAVEVAVVNAPRLGGRLGVNLPAARPDDGRLSVIVLQGGALRRSLLSLVHLLRAGTERRTVPGVAAAGEVIDIASPDPRPVSLDGEPATTTPIRIRVQPGACDVIVASPPRRRRHR